MSAHTILPHQLAASILFFYGGVALFCSRMKGFRYPKPQKRPPRSVRPLSYLDVDLKYCTQNELQYIVVQIRCAAQQRTLTDRERARLLEVDAEVERRAFVYSK